jgi:hypothetical protein
MPGDFRRQLTRFWLSSMLSKCRSNHPKGGRPPILLIDEIDRRRR